MNFVNYALIGLGAIAIVGYLGLVVYYAFKNRKKLFAFLTLTLVYIFIGIVYSGINGLIFASRIKNEFLVFVISFAVVAFGLFLANLISKNKLFNWYSSLEVTLTERDSGI
ncbi:MAG: hypothetical protein ACRCXZ_02315 [Patescibacteria group bacterium]